MGGETGGAGTTKGDGGGEAGSAGGVLPWGGVTPESIREGFLGKWTSGSGWEARGVSGRARVLGGTARSPVSEAADAKVTEMRPCRFLSWERAWPSIRRGVRGHGRMVNTGVTWAGFLGRTLWLSRKKGLVGEGGGSAAGEEEEEGMQLSRQQMMAAYRRGRLREAP